MINLSVLKNFTRAKKYPQGTILPGDSILDALYIVLTGEVGIFANYRKNNQQLIATIGPGEYFGESKLFSDQSRTSSAIALTDVIALPINRINAIAFIKEEPEMAFELMKSMYINLDGVSTAYEKMSGHPWIAPLTAPANGTAVQATEIKKIGIQDKVKSTRKTVAASPASPLPNGAAPIPPVTTAPAHSSVSPSGASAALFPTEHGSYQLALHNEDRTHLLEKSFTCPICKKEFTAFKIRTANLALESTDDDMRCHYRGFEPLYYEIITCPHCLYSALVELFDHPDKPNMALPIELAAIRQEAGFVFGAAMDSLSVFASYYLALKCAPVFFSKHHFITAKVLLKLSRIYQDCGDKKMEEDITKQALDAYQYVYENIQNSPNQDQQLCIVIGELYLKTNDIANAKSFFFKARALRTGIPRMQKHAENRVQEIYEMEKKAAKAQPPV